MSPEPLGYARPQMIISPADPVMAHEFFGRAVQFQRAFGELKAPNYPPHDWPRYFMLCIRIILFVHYQASAEHFQQCAEYLPLRNRGLGPLAVKVLPIPLARRAAATACAAVQPTAPLFCRR